MTISIAGFRDARMRLRPRPPPHSNMSARLITAPEWRTFILTARGTRSAGTGNSGGLSGGGFGGYLFLSAGGLKGLRFALLFSGAQRGAGRGRTGVAQITGGGASNACVAAPHRHSPITYDAHEHRFVNGAATAPTASPKSAEKTDATKEVLAGERAAAQGRGAASPAANVRVPAANVRAVAPPSRAVAAPSRAMAPPPRPSASASAGGGWSQGGSSPGSSAASGASSAPHSAPSGGASHAPSSGGGHPH